MAPVAILPTAAPASYASPSSSHPLKPVPLPRRRPGSSSTTTQKSTKHLLWTLSPSVASETIDPETLLTEADLAAPETCAPPSSEAGAGKPKRRKACKNCSCGLAEQEAEEASASLPTPPSESPFSPEQQRQKDRARLMELAAQIERGELITSCGKCSMGDTFRCPSCPYVGLPAFTPGEKVEIDFGDDDL